VFCFLTEEILNLILLRYNQRNGKSTQRIINAHYNQRLFSKLDLHTKYEPKTCLALPTSVVQDLNEKIAGNDCMMH
jgi:hypothetical protein